MATLVEPDLQVLSSDELGDKLAEISRLAGAGHLNMSYLLSWSLLEAVARSAMAPNLAKAQSASAIVERLAFEGYVTPTEATELRAKIALRNRLVHGDFSASATITDIDDLVTMIRRVHELGATEGNQKVEE